MSWLPGGHGKFTKNLVRSAAAEICSVNGPNSPRECCFDLRCLKERRTESLIQSHLTDQLKVLAMRRTNGRREIQLCCGNIPEIPGSRSKRPVRAGRRGHRKYWRGDGVSHILENTDHRRKIDEHRKEWKETKLFLVRFCSSFFFAFLFGKYLSLV